MKTKSLKGLLIPIILVTTIMVCGSDVPNSSEQDAGQGMFEKSKKEEFAALHSQRVVVMHGEKSGALPALNHPDVLNLIESGYRVACCYPAAVAERYAFLRVIGDW